MNVLKRHLAIILSLFMIFTMCPSTLYASSIDTAGVAATEITEPEPDTAPDEIIVEETENTAEEIVDETVDGTVDETIDDAAPVIEETISDTAPDTDEYAEEPAPETDPQDITPSIDENPESEDLVGKPITVGTNVTATFDSSTGAIVLTSNGGTLWPGWASKAGLNPFEIKSIKVASGTVYCPADSCGLFHSFSNLKTLDLSHFGYSKITDASYMFYECSSLKSLDLSILDTSKCTNMDNMFCGCTSLTDLNIVFFDTSNVKSMIRMFRNCVNGRKRAFLTASYFSVTILTN